MLDNICKSCFQPNSKPVCPHCGYDSTLTFNQFHLRPGTILQGKYMIGMKLGQGGFGITYLAYNLELNVKVAVKEFLPSNISSRGSDGITVYSQNGGEREIFEKGKSDFIKEGMILARLGAVKSIVSIYDAFEANNTAYLVMEYLDGQSLSDYLRNGNKLTVEQTMHLILPIMESLEKVHKANLLHRDISPDNIYILKNGKVKLIDFGAARSTANQGQSMTVIFKAGYAPIEQYSSRMQGPWTDVYGLATTFYRCITGMVPVPSIQLQADRKFHMPPSQLGVSINPGMENALMKGLALSHTDRYQSVAQFKNALLQGETVYPPVDGGGTVPPNNPNDVGNEPTVYQGYAPKPKPKNNNAILFAALGILGCAAILLIVIMLTRNPVETTNVNDDDQENQVELLFTEKATDVSDNQTQGAQPDTEVPATQAPITPEPVLEDAKWTVVGSSRLVPQDTVKFNYDADNVLDGLSKGFTDCWIPGNNRSGEGEYLDFYLSNGYEAEISMIRIQNGGYRTQKEEGLPIAQTRYCRNCRAKDIEIAFDDGTSMTVTLDDMNMEFQDIVIPEGVKTSTIKITFLSVYDGYDGFSTANDGKGNKDLMISEIEIIGKVIN